MKILHFLFNATKNVGAIRKDIKEGDVVVVSPSKELVESYEDILNKQLTEKKDAKEDLHALGKTLKSVTDDAAYHTYVDHTLDKVYGILCQGMLLSFKDDSLNTYLKCFLVQLCSQAVSTLLGCGDAIDGRNLIYCESNNGIPVVDWELTEKNVLELQHSPQCVVGGSYGHKVTGETVDLGKHSSELTANILASILGADVVRFYVSGLENYDAMTLTYEEAAQCFSGGFPIYPPAMIPVRDKEVKVEVADLDQEGKVVITIAAVQEAEIERGISGVFVSEPMSLVTIYGAGLLGNVGMSSIIFDLLAKNGINIHFISQSLSEYSISFAVKRVKAELAEQALMTIVNEKNQKHISDLSFTIRPVSIVSVYGQGIKNLPGISGRVYTALGNEGINVIAASQGGEELSISIVIDEKDATTAKSALLRLK